MKKGLGKGLGALIPGIGEESSFADLDEILGGAVAVKKMEKTSSSKKEDNSGIKSVSIMNVEPCRGQPRTSFDENSLNELANSIKTYGIIQPIIVRAINNDRYEIIAGERRWRAAQIAGLKKIPIVERILDNENMMELALVENLQRVDLNPIDEALGYKTLIEKYKCTQDEIAKKIGKNRSTISNSLRILSLPDSIKELVETGDLSYGHARALTALKEENKQKEITEKIIKKDLSVRSTEKLIKSMQKPIEENRSTKVISEEMKIFLQNVERKLENKFGTKVKILPSKNKNKIEIEYYTNRDLGRILEVLDI